MYIYIYIHTYTYGERERDRSNIVQGVGSQHEFNIDWYGRCAPTAKTSVALTKLLGSYEPHFSVSLSLSLSISLSLSLSLSLYIYI